MKTCRLLVASFCEWKAYIGQDNRNVVVVVDVLVFAWFQGKEDAISFGCLLGITLYAQIKKESSTLPGNGVRMWSPRGHLEPYLAAGIMDVVQN